MFVTRLVLAEIDSEHTLIDDMRVQERDRALSGLRDVVEHLVVKCCRGRRAAKREDHLLTAGTYRHQVDLLLIDDISLGKRLGRIESQRLRGSAAGYGGNDGQQ